MERISLQDLIRRRRSVRRFLEKPVPRDAVLACLEAARLAPSAENVQPWRFIVIDDPEVKEAFCREVFSGIYAPTRFAARAPVLVLVLSRPDIVANRLGKMIQGVPYHLIDIGISGEHFVLQAQELGLGTCWIGWFDLRRARKFFRIPRSHKIVSLIALGYAEPWEERPKKRKALEEIVSFNSFQGNKPVLRREKHLESKRERT